MKRTPLMEKAWYLALGTALALSVTACSNGAEQAVETADEPEAVEEVQAEEPAKPEAEPTPAPAEETTEPKPAVEEPPAPTWEPAQTFGQGSGALRLVNALDTDVSELWVKASDSDTWPDELAFTGITIPAGEAFEVDFELDADTVDVWILDAEGTVYSAKQLAGDFTPELGAQVKQDDGVLYFEYEAEDGTVVSTLEDALAQIEAERIAAEEAAAAEAERIAAEEAAAAEAAAQAAAQQTYSEPEPTYYDEPTYDEPTYYEEPSYSEDVSQSEDNCLGDMWDE